MARQRVCEDFSMTLEKIRDYCQIASTISRKHGTRDGLTFLIGEKLSLVYLQLKNERNKLKFLYTGNLSENKKNPALKKNKSLQISYTLTINENYRGVFEQVDHLEKAIDLFVDEIKRSFTLQSIQDYLGSFPRLAFSSSSQALFTTSSTVSLSFASKESKRSERKP